MGPRASQAFDLIAGQLPHLKVHDSLSSAVFGKTGIASAGIASPGIANTGIGTVPLQFPSPAMMLGHICTTPAMALAPAAPVPLTNIPPGFDHTSLVNLETTCQV